MHERIIIEIDLPEGTEPQKVSNIKFETVSAIAKIAKANQIGAFAVGTEIKNIE